MQEIIIGENTFLPYNDGFTKILIKVFGKNEAFWNEFESLHPKLYGKIRTNKKLINYFKQNGCVLYKDRHNQEDIKVKIVQIPDDVDWDIGEYECALKEYVYEKYRTWC